MRGWILLLVLAACSGDDDGGTDAGPPTDAGRDAGAIDDAATPDAPLPLDDGGPPDAGAPDAGPAVIVREVVTVEDGALRGAAVGDDLYRFLGIPYAQAPVGPLRFAPPRPHGPWSELRDATAYGPSCPQFDVLGAQIGEEDCLHLNVWAHPMGNPRPVMLFIHGGTFVGGRTSEALYEGSDLARASGAVIVTINYRIGVLGSLSSAALEEELGDGSLGNQGLRDQIAALEWVQRNIRVFGGDPTNVTLFGESAGGFSICALLGAPSADDLFQRGIIESGGGCFGFEDPRVSDGTRPSRLERGEAFTTAAGCDPAAPTDEELACLRTRSVGEILMAQAPAVDERTFRLEFGPAVDGVVMPEQPLERLRRGEGDRPIIVGANRDDARILTFSRFFSEWAQFETFVRNVIPDAADADAVIALYPRARYTPQTALDTFGTDIAFACPTVSLAEASAAGPAPTHVYQFDRVPEGIYGALGATHIVELFYVFGNFPDGYVPPPEDLAVEAAMQGAWSSFARDGIPALRPRWSAYDPAFPEFAIFDAPSGVVAELRGGRCADYRRLGIIP